MNHIANNTKMIRNALGLTQGELAEKTGSNLKCVASYERGVSPPYEFLIALSKLSGISIHDIIVTEFNSVNLKCMNKFYFKTVVTNLFRGYQYCDISESFQDNAFTVCIKIGDENGEVKSIMKTYSDRDYEDAYRCLLKLMVETFVEKSSIAIEQ